MKTIIIVVVCLGLSLVAYKLCNWFFNSVDLQLWRRQRELGAKLGTVSPEEAKRLFHDLKKSYVRTNTVSKSGIQKVVFFASQLVPCGIWGDEHPAMRNIPQHESAFSVDDCSVWRTLSMVIFSLNTNPNEQYKEEWYFIQFDRDTLEAESFGTISPLRDACGRGMYYVTGPDAGVYKLLK